MTTPEDRLELLKALETYAPQGDGLELVQALTEALSDSHVDIRTFVNQDRPLDAFPVVSLTVRPQNLVAFLNILRSGITPPEPEDAKIIPMQRS